MTKCKERECTHIKLIFSVLKPTNFLSRKIAYPRKALRLKNLFRRKKWDLFLVKLDESYFKIIPGFVHISWNQILHATNRTTKYNRSLLLYSCLTDLAVVCGATTIEYPKSKNEDQKGLAEPHRYIFPSIFIHFFFRGSTFFFSFFFRMTD